MKNILVLLACVIISPAFAQFPGGGGGNRGGGQAPSIGHFYGKIVDGKTNKGIDGATIELVQSKFDTVTKKRKDAVLKAQLTEANGDFSLENLPIFGQFKLKISAIGYTPIEQAVKFEMKPGGDQSSMMNNIDRDLGNIKMTADAKELDAVKIVATKPFFEMGVDRKIFNVEKNIVSTGQTATELMKNIPGVNVDIDGNVTLRNANPTIFVDGRPTTLTLDQIPSDAIASVELITNPSAKYDASGGTAGIINIILKKNRKAGYNGNLRAGVDSRGKFNGGADINVKQGKINFFASINANQRKSIGKGFSYRQNLYDTPRTNVSQYTDSKNNGFFTFGRIGFDYLIDNRNTITFSQNIVRGSFKGEDDYATVTDSMYTPIVSQNSERKALSSRDFRNYGTALGYKHLFTKPGMELTADANFNANKNTGTSNYTTQYFVYDHTPTGDPTLQTQDNSGTSKFWTFQSDFVAPLTEKSKLEAGLRGAIRNVNSVSDNFIYDYTLDEYVPVPIANANYKYNDQVYAAYSTYSNVIGKTFTYQVGLRVESSKYTGEMLNTHQTFTNSYPFSLFPSVFLTQKLKGNQDLQLNYSRRINRPNFFQLMPFLDYSDSLNIRRGNPNLKPEFTNSFELNYNKAFAKGHSLLISAYYKRTEDLITGYQEIVTSPANGKSIIVNTYINANHSRAYGLEFTAKNPLFKWLDATTNLNFYNSAILSDTTTQENINDIWSFLGKLNLNFKLPKNFSIQLSGDYQSKTILPQGGGGQGGRGGGPGGGGGGGFGFTPTTAQGYIRPTGGVDVAIRKEFLKDKKAALTLSMNDIFKTRVYDTHTESPYFIQDSWRRRDWQVVRLNFSYRFGKFDVSLFKRKNNRSGMEGATEGLQQ